MLLGTLARSRFDSDSNCTFDGKIGCFPFVTFEAAKRSSSNRPMGTIEMKPIESIMKEVVRTFLTEKVLPAIRAKWPREDINKPIYIQQDNARCWGSGAQVPQPRETMEEPGSLWVRVPRYPSGTTDGHPGMDHRTRRQRTFGTIREARQGRSLPNPKAAKIVI